MKKLLSLSLIVMVCLAMLTGCSGSKANTGTLSLTVSVRKSTYASLKKAGVDPFKGATVTTATVDGKPAVECKREYKNLGFSEAEAQVVRMMFNLCVSAGYGRWRLTGFLNDKGIKTRKGVNWQDATVGAILHNVMYKGVLRSGKSYSEPFKELQIIDPETFDLAQKLMIERVNEKKDTRTVPLNTAGQSLLSGNIFCGHCGGRLVLTTNGKVVKMANGERKGYKRIRYICYNKTRRRMDCDGQTGYTMHIVDDAVTNVLHQIFDRMNSASDNVLLGCVEDGTEQCQNPGNEI